MKKSDGKKLLKRVNEEDQSLKITDLTKMIKLQDTKIEMLIAIINNMCEEHGNQEKVNKSVKKQIENNIDRIDHIENFLDTVQAELIDEDDRIIN